MGVYTFKVDLRCTNEQGEKEETAPHLVVAKAKTVISGVGFFFFLTVSEIRHLRHSVA